MTYKNTLLKGIVRGIGYALNTEIRRYFKDKIIKRGKRCPNQRINTSYSKNSRNNKQEEQITIYSCTACNKNFLQHVIEQRRDQTTCFSCGCISSLRKKEVPAYLFDVLTSYNNKKRKEA